MLCLKSAMNPFFSRNSSIAEKPVKFLKPLEEAVRRLLSPVIRNTSICFSHISDTEAQMKASGMSSRFFIFLKGGEPENYASSILVA